MTQKAEQQFIKIVYDYYQTNGRHSLPWRKTTDPYRILVSEIMLQQTQVDRVLPKYQAFLKTFPTVHKLAVAPLGSVLKAWQGLGYNRRAKYLHQCVQTLVTERGGKFPLTYDELKQLPGIGPYTAGAVMAFAYNQPVPIIETNIRTVFLHHFFNNETDVREAAIVQLVAETLDTKQPRRWYAALMDYGAYLKKEHGNPNSRSQSYAKQSTFAGSDRQIRGAILRSVSDTALTRRSLHTQLSAFDPLRIDAQLERLLAEGMVVKVGQRFLLP